MQPYIPHFTGLTPCNELTSSSVERNIHSASFCTLWISASFSWDFLEVFFPFGTLSPLFPLVLFALLLPPVLVSLALLPFFMVVVFLGVVFLGVVFLGVVFLGLVAYFTSALARASSSFLESVHNTRHLHNHRVLKAFNNVWQANPRQCIWNYV